VLAISPEGNNYRQERKRITQEAGRCVFGNCLPCSEIEFQCSLVFNKNEHTKDQFIMPFGHLFEDEQVYVLGVQLKLRSKNENLDGVLWRVKTTQNFVVEKFDARRIRGECVFKQVENGVNVTNYLLRRARFCLS
jgi:hypothetical protein